MMADNQMRKRDDRLADQAKHKGKADPLYDKPPTQDVGGKPVKFFRPGDFTFNGDTCTCPASKQL